jgi:hypothetical protein
MQERHGALQLRLHRLTARIVERDRPEFARALGDRRRGQAAGKDTGKATGKDNRDQCRPQQHVDLPITGCDWFCAARSDAVTIVGSGNSISPITTPSRALFDPSILHHFLEFRKRARPSPDRVILRHPNANARASTDAQPRRLAS